MGTIWCAISGHGFGHAAQVVPILNELGRRVPQLNALLRTTVPASFFKDRLHIPWSLQPVTQDVGCVQPGPLEIDVAATWEAHEQFRATWDSRLEAEISKMRALRPAVILADTPYLAVSAGREAGIPTIVTANLTWHEILTALEQTTVHHQPLLQSIRDAYGKAEMALRIAPGLPLAGIQKVVDIGPIADPAPSERENLRSSLGMKASERLVLVGFGGIPLGALPWEQMEHMGGYRFLVDGLLPPDSSRIHSLSTIPCSFKTALASVDVVMTKPGYGTILEAVALRLPVVYVRRYNFADEVPLLEFLHTYGQGCELSLADFVSGQWRAALDEALTACPMGERPALTGPADAAEALRGYFQ
ncbi:MAG TPA: hypothetical protein VJR69_13845 [Nitrospira sp.]|nr:hypothetical protein [Nitrospira sp.]